jgi:putative ABC transport system permease protein
MFSNQACLFWRHVRRQPVYAFINIFGLAAGMAACLLIVLFIEREVSFEDMHQDRDRIYRVLTIDKALGTNNQRVGITMPAVGWTIADAFPEIDAAVRMTFGGQTLLRRGSEMPIYAEQLRNADPNVFDVFDFEFVEGNPETALREPYSLVLTESLARSLFGNESAVGQPVQTGGGLELTVTAVLRDLPENTHFEFDALGSMETVTAQARANQQPGSTNAIFTETWNSVAMPTYARFAPGASAEGFDARLTQHIRENGVAENFDITLQPLTEVHLGSSDVIFDPVQNKGDRNTVIVFAAIALLILLIAVVNYLNLSTARSTDRAREVGMRKVVGSTEGQLVRQFMVESVLTAFSALVLALVLAWALLPALNALAETDLRLATGNPLLLIGSALLLVLIAGVLAGLYPAFALARFQPIAVLKGRFKTSRNGQYVRVGLVVFQFALSIALIGTTGMVQKQLNYIQERDMGYDREQVMLLDMVDGSMAQTQDLFREELERNAAFTSVSTAGNVPGRGFGRTRVRPEGVPDEDIWIWSNMAAAPETLPALGIDMALGRNFDRNREADNQGVVIVNETAVAQLGWEDPVGRRIYIGTQDSVGTQVIGVARDFNFSGIHQPIEPLIIFPLASNPGGTVVARVQAGQVPGAVQAAEAAWRSVYPDYPFSYTFLDDEFDELYAQDRVTGRVVNVFSMLAILIACLGLFGLASYATTQRTKEIGVRKVLGASSGSIMQLLVVDFAKWVLLANVVAWPLAWIASNRWLDSFAYRVEVDWLILIGASVIALLIAVVTVLSQTWSAARLNPATALRHD